MQNKKVFIVDDEPDILEFLKYNLQKEGYEVDVFEKSMAAFEQVKSHHPDIIVSDWLMPYMNGLDLLGAVKNNPETKHIPFIIISCKSDEKDVVMALEFGAEDYLVKPFGYKELSARIRKTLNKNVGIFINGGYKRAYSKIEKQNQKITESIASARRIQNAMLPAPGRLSAIFPESFVLYQPKDMVSGDFYWLDSQTEEDKIRSHFVAVADCTGHGVPGAFMSVLGNTLLTHIVSEMKISEPGKILDELDRRVILALNHTQSMLEAKKDGMDIALCKIDLENNQLHFAGALRSAYVLREKVLYEIKGNRYPIGGFQIEAVREYQNNIFSLQKGDTVYLTSDGYASQFGGAAGKKFMTRQFRNLLSEISAKTMSEQKELLEKKFREWKGALEQTDDVLVIGVRI